MAAIRACTEQVSPACSQHRQPPQRKLWRHRAGRAQPHACLAQLLTLQQKLGHSRKNEADGDSATGKSHSLALLGFSDSRIRRVTLPCHVLSHLTFTCSDATAVSRVIAASQVPPVARLLRKIFRRSHFSNAFIGSCCV